MNKNMVKLFIIFLIFSINIHTVSAIPPFPESYWGYATINGVPAANGTSITVEVYDTGEIIGSTTVQFENGGYSVNVEFDDPFTSEDEGADEGDKLTWKLGGVICSTPAQGTDIATSGNVNGDFDLVLGSNDQRSFGDVSSGGDDDVGTSDEALEDMQPTKPSKETNDPLTADHEESSGEMPVDKKPAVSGFNFITGIFSMLIVIQIFRINK